MDERAQPLLMAYGHARAMQMQYDQTITAQLYFGFSALKSAEANALRMLRSVAPGIWVDPVSAMKKVENLMQQHNAWYAFLQVANSPEEFGKLVGSGFLWLRTTHARKLAGQPWNSYRYATVLVADDLQQTLSRLGEAQSNLLGAQNRLHTELDAVYGQGDVDQAIEVATKRAEARRGAVKALIIVDAPVSFV